MKFGLTDREYDEIKILYFLFPNIDDIIVFGSRARGDHKKTSDIDLALKGNLSHLDIVKIRDYFEDSRLPYIVDVVVYDKVSSEDFKKNIDEEGIVL